MKERTGFQILINKWKNLQRKEEISTIYMDKIISLKDRDNVSIIIWGHLIMIKLLLKRCNVRT